jgi:serine/threonine-protein kinase RIO1
MVLMRNRIQTLCNDYRNVNHFFSKAIIETELERLVDDYLERAFILQRNQQRQSEETTDRN